MSDKVISINRRLEQKMKRLIELTPRPVLEDALCNLPVITKEEGEAMVTGEPSPNP
jgi:hypothetical protein